MRTGKEYTAAISRGVSGMLVLILAVYAAGSCERKKKEEMPVPKAGPAERAVPAWIDAEMRRITEEDRPAFYGTGSARGIRNASLLRATADNRARSAVARSLQGYLDSLLQGYGRRLAPAETREVTEMTIPGIEIINHWEDPDTGGLYALAKLDLSSVKRSIEDSGRLDAGVRAYLLDNADRHYRRHAGQ